MFFFTIGGSAASVSILLTCHCRFCPRIKRFLNAVDVFPSVDESCLLSRDECDVAEDFGAKGCVTRALGPGYWISQLLKHPMRRLLRKKAT